MIGKEDSTHSKTTPKKSRKSWNYDLNLNNNQTVNP